MKQERKKNLKKQNERIGRMRQPKSFFLISMYESNIRISCLKFK